MGEYLPLQGKLALVTGAGTGIGQGIAGELARQGASVVLHYSQSSEGALRTAQEIVQNGGKAFTVQGDLSQVEVCRRVVDTAAESLGGLDFLVNNAALTKTADFMDTTPEIFDLLFHLNMRGYFFCAQTAVKWMLERGRGSILNISSIHAHGGVAKYAAYAATKGAINAFTRELAVELASHNIRVNCIAPGAIEVERYWKNNPNYSRERTAQVVTRERVGLPEDISRVAAFMLTEAADFVTGQILYVDGGTTAELSLNAVHRTRKHYETK